MDKYQKVYIAVTLYVDRNGRTIPIALDWEDGLTYEIDSVLDERMSPPKHVGGFLTRKYEVTVKGKTKTLFLETQSNKWFIEKPLYE